MYGPPPDPRQRIAPVEIFDSVDGYIVCLLIALLVSSPALWRARGVHFRSACFVLGQTILLTAPLAYFLDTYMYGSFPTVDKIGSMAFYFDEIHLRMMAHPIDSINDPTVRLIGVDIGHFWLIQIFDTILSPMAAFNIQGLLYPALGWWCAWWLFFELTNNPRISMLMAFPYGMGLHVFRDLNWFSGEQSAIFWIPLFLVVVVRARRDGGPWLRIVPLVLFLSFWANVYFGLLNALLLASIIFAVFVSKDSARHRLFRAGVLASVAISPLLLWQWLIFLGAAGPGATNTIASQPVALDLFTLSPLKWGGLEGHRALNIIAVGLAAAGIWKARQVQWVRFATATAAMFCLLAMGPMLWGDGPANPVFMAARAVVPWFSHVAKPEVFFHVTWLMLLAIGALQGHRWGWSKRVTSALYCVFIFGWLVMIRTHPAYPPMTMPMNLKLDANWESRLLGQ